MVLLFGCSSQADPPEQAVNIMRVSLPSEMAEDPNHPRPSLEEWQILFANYMEQVKSDDVLRNALRQEMTQSTQWYASFKIGTDTNGQPVFDVTAAVIDLRSRLRVHHIEGSALFMIHVEGPNHNDSVRLTMAVTETFLQSVNAQINNQQESIRRVLIKERDRMEEASRNLSAGISRYIRENQQNDTDKRSYNRDLKQLEQQLETIDQRIAAISDLLDDMRVYRNSPDSTPVRLVDSRGM